jgi:hypothetical protein
VAVGKPTMSDKTKEEKEKEQLKKERESDTITA